MTVHTASQPVVEVSALTKRYRGVTAVDDVSFSLAPDRIYGLLGRNGAGKTTVMSLLTAQEFATSGQVRVFGRSPVEDADVLDRVCFVKESQTYPDDFKVRHVLATAPDFFEAWDDDLAARLVEDFRLPVARRVKKLSRGQLSAVGVVVGLASRAPLTFFDEPYLGLDAVARQLFYDRLLADYAEHPRTVVLSTHLIDEVGDLLEHVLLLDEGRLLLDDDVETLRGSALTLAGTAATVERFTAGREVLRTERLGGLATATVQGLDAADRAAARDAGLELGQVSLQQLVVSLTSTNTRTVETGTLQEAS